MVSVTGLCARFSTYGTDIKHCSELMHDNDLDIDFAVSFEAFQSVAVLNAVSPEWLMFLCIKSFEK